MWIFRPLPLKLRADVRLAQKTMTVKTDIKRVGMVPSHEFLLAGVFERFSQGNHVVHDILIICNDACFKSFNWEGKDVSYDEGVWGEWVGAAEEETHYFDWISAFLHAFFYSRMAVRHLKCIFGGR